MRPTSPRSRVSTSDCSDGRSRNSRARGRAILPATDGRDFALTDRSTKIEIQFEEHYARPVWPGAAGAQGMQLHLDIWVEDVPSGVAWAIACGATEADRQPEDRDPNRLRIMLDPAGHPFCLWS